MVADRVRGAPLHTRISPSLCGRTLDVEHCAVEFWLSVFVVNMSTRWNVTESDKVRVNNKRRQVNVSEWKDKKRKSLKDSGKSYVSNRGKGTVIAEKTPPTSARGCKQHCRKSGCNSLRLQSVRTLHQQFYELTYDEQTLFLMRFISIRNPIRRRPGKTDQTSMRLAAFDYNVDGKAVCQKTLCNVFCLTPRRIQILQEKIKNGEVAPKDKRGKHFNRPHAIDADARKMIRDHIKSFPLQTNHYSRKKSSKECLSPDLSIEEMYRLFKAKFPDVGVSCSTYRKVFTAEFNLRFGNPRSDTCKQCDLLYTRLTMEADEEERSKIVQESWVHHSKADQAYASLANDAKNDSVITICVDLQQVLLTPTLTHSDIYYQRQYSSYNLAIHNMTNNTANMFLWHESIAKRGSKEIGSCILKYVTATFRKLQQGEERKLIVWSDRCIGQNNNWTILNVYHYLITSGFFTEIQQKFLVSGHSFLPCDRDFAVIERARKNKQALVPSDWKYIIASAKINCPFLVFEMSQSDFKDIDGFSNGTKKKLQITKFTWYKLSADDPTSLYARETHNTLRPWISAQVFPHMSIQPDYEDIPRLYNGPLPISKEKKADLMEMTKYLINEEHRQFYEHIPSA